MATLTRHEPEPQPTPPATYTLELTEGEALFLKIHLSMTSIDEDMLLINTAHIPDMNTPTHEEILSVRNQLLNVFPYTHNNVRCTVEVI